MIRSMTGFGKAAVKSKHSVVTVELRTINHKFFELSAKLPNGLAQFEDKLKSAIQRMVKRGKVYLSVDINSQKNGISGVTINKNTALRYKKELERLQRALNLSGNVELDQILALPGVVTAETAKADSRKDFPFVKKALSKALGDLLSDREKEGAALFKDLNKRAVNITTAIKHVEERATISIIKYKDHLTKRIKELAGTKNVDKGRLEQEVALFAKNSDISEELVRLKSHLASFSETLVSRAESGKKLDFIAQELHREVNTIASKSSDFKISRYAIHIKSDIEKIREQVKNIE